MVRNRLQSHADWRRFEVERWRSAVRERGLSVRFLDAEQQQALLEAMHVPLRRAADRLGQTWKRLRRVASIAVLLMLGYVLRDVVHAAAATERLVVSAYSNAYAQTHCEPPDVWYPAFGGCIQVPGRNSGE